MRILVTGAGGFVGSALVEELRRRGDEVIGAGRREVGEIGPETDWRPLLAGAETVIHLANRAHVMTETGGDPEALFHRINVEGSVGLAEQAAAAGARRLVFVSSIKANGEETHAEAFTNTSQPAPWDAYGRSKWEAEQRLAAHCARTGLELVVVRPPLIYGPRVKGNLRTLMNVVAKGIPLPLALVENRRSLIGLGNFCDVLALMARHPAAPGTWLVRDDEDLSTPELIRRMARALGRPPRLLPFPPALLRLAGRLTGRSAAVGRVLGSLQVDDRATRAALGWTPPMSVDEGLTAMAAEP
ncbi:NAD-dependent epimerase/dehydratase [Paramagnetospirillum caucaseum]|uniref:NAD-dependent epimerase/dehydratase n=1 Tax=Paramagnetospirillum caucaseum TaxID=1244869 RepID=M3A9G9_9PROT|nr:NAD-dependent epimerase/dehydratase family protein [Paramagnetospirillum caucaseum]EME69134.1 NAD-dependent epimerase/dehydratase [Paramagnetospirillum caucaseum]